MDFAGTTAGSAPFLLVGLALLSMPAAAQEFTSPGGATAKFYGQFNLGYLSYDDGGQTTSRLVDNANSNSRVGFWLEFPFQNETKLRFNAEAAVGFFQSNKLTVDGVESSDWFDWDESYIRKFELNYVTPYGSFWAGQGSMATDGIAEVDFSGTTVIGFSDYGAVAGGFAFRRADGSLSSITVGKVFTNLEGSRRFRLRYDTPEFSGFTLSIAGGEDVIVDSDKTYYDIAARYSGKFGDVKVGGGLGYNLTEETGKDDVENLTGSVAILHEPSGLNGAFSIGSVTDGGEYFYLKAGWIGDLVASGSTALAVEYFDSNEIGITDGGGTSWGLMAVQKIDDYDSELYLGFREYEISQTGTDYEDSTSLFVGGRWKF
jgi:hypothetical protein